MSYFHDPSHALTRFSRGTQAEGDEYPCTISQWHPDHGFTHHATERSHEIQTLKDAPLTIINAPLDDLSTNRIAGLTALALRYEIPGTFLDECNRHVVNSFGYQENDDITVTSTWLRFLLKEIDQEEVVPSNPSNNHSPLFSALQAIRSFFSHQPLQNKASETKPSGPRIPLLIVNGEVSAHSSNWTKCAFFIRVERLDETGLPQHRVTLICFHTPPTIAAELHGLDRTSSIRNIVDHPFILWEIITYHLSVFLEEEVFSLTECFGTEQRNLGYITSKPLMSLADMDFSSLHLLADHIVLLLEGARGLSASMDCLISGHGIASGQLPSSLSRKTQHALEYRQRFVQSTFERALTFEKRINNMTGLFFNHMSLQDSGFMMRDSSSLRTIAVLTLVFLPITTVATVCGSEFFYTAEGEDGNPISVKMMESVWLMFLLSGLMTLGLMMVWQWNTNKIGKAFSRGAGPQSRPRSAPMAV